MHSKSSELLLVVGTNGGGGKPCSLDDVLGAVLRYAVADTLRANRIEFALECIPLCFLQTLKKENASEAGCECRFLNINAWARLQTSNAWVRLQKWLRTVGDAPCTARGHITHRAPRNVTDTPRTSHHARSGTHPAPRTLGATHRAPRSVGDAPRTA